MALENAFGALALDTTLASTNTKLDNILTELNAKLEAGQQVALDSATLAALETISLANTDYPDAAVLAKLEAIRVILAGTLSVNIGLTDAQLRATAVPVSVTGVSTETTSAAILAKIIAAPATEAKQDTGNTSLGTIVTNTGRIPALGQAVAASSSPVVIASNQTSIPIVESAVNVTGQSAQTATVNNILTTTSGSTATDVADYRSMSVQLVSTANGGTFIFEQSNDNTNFVALPVFNAALVTGVPITAAITSTVSQIVYTIPLRCRYIRLRIATTITGGSIQAFSKISTEPWTAAAQLVASNTAANLAVTASLAATQTLTTVTTVGTVTTLSQFLASAAAADATANPTSTGVRSFKLNFNGTTWDRNYGNLEATLLASAARTTTQTSADIINYNWKKLVVVLDMTVVGTGSVTVTIDGKDTASGKYYNILTGAAIVTNSTNRYRIGETLAAAANSVAQDYIPRIIRIVVTANNANTATYSVGYNFGL